LIPIIAAGRALRSVRGLLWTAVVLAVGTLIGLIVHGYLQEQEKDDRVEAVSLYVRRVNGVERGLAIDLGHVRATYRRFGEGVAELRSMADDLDAAVETIAAARDRIAALTPPPEAARLHGEILRLIGLELELSREVRDMGRVLPRIAAGSERTNKASRLLLRDLRAAETLSDQAAAFHRYGRSLGQVAGEFSRLNPPPALKPSLESETKRLRKLSALAKKTGNALEQKQIEGAQELSNRLAKAAAASAIVTKAERTAIAEYRRRVRAVGAQERVVAKERERVAAALA
jgi:hypothetical protein